jgi:tryptophan synthase alpha chain
MAFMPFVTAGDPDMETTQAVVRELASRGVDLIEVGFPYSDPIADGPVIQASYTRALGRKITVRGVLDGIAALQPGPLPPLAAMVSYAIVFRVGPGPFVRQAKDAGFSGLIVPDLPGDEAAELFELVRGSGLDLSQLVAPTTPRERARQVLQACSGFVYCVAVAGTTGERDQVQDELLAQLRWLRQETDLPLCVGFGIGKPEHVGPLRGVADGVIVGSAIVRHLQSLADGKTGREQTIRAIGEFAGTMAAAAHGTPE